MDFLVDLGLFMAKAAILVVAVIAVISAIGAAVARNRHHPSDDGHLETRSLNDHFLDLRRSVEAALLPGPAAKARQKAEAKARQKEEKQKAKALKKADTAPEPERPRVFVLDFDGDVQASATGFLAEEVSGVLAVAQEGDTVLLRLESPGGVVHGYGLAASQLARLKDKGVTLVAAVDRVAASGGYMMACIADRIISAPFAVLGSIGVIVQMPNVHRFLKNRDIDVEMLTAGEYKRTLTVIGENTEEGRQKLQEEIDDVHVLFKEHVAEHRPSIDIEAVATGEAWYGKRALERGLTDELLTSDAWLQARAEEADLIEVRWVRHEKPVEKFIHRFAEALGRASERVLGRLAERSNHIQ